MIQPEPRARLLSFDGGGIRGLFALQYAKPIETLLRGRPETRMRCWRITPTMWPGRVPGRSSRRSCHGGCRFIPSVLPGIAAWTLAMISVFEFRRRAGLYNQLVGALQRLRPKLSEAKCASAAEAAVRQIERLLLNELWEWQGPRRK